MKKQIMKKQIEQIIKDIPFEPIKSECRRLLPKFCDPTYYKKYRVLTLEQAKVAIDYFISLNFTNEDIDVFIADAEQDDESKLGPMSLLYFNSENSINVGHNDDFDFAYCTLTENDSTIKFRKWMKDNDIKTELNCGMMHLFICMLEAI